MRALRGAITVDEDTKSQITSATKRLLEEMLSLNELSAEDLVSIHFTCTQDLSAEFPAVGAREMGLSDVPLLCGIEMNGPDSPLSVPRCVRVMMYAYTDRDPSAVRHVYLEGAKHLRPDLAE